MGKIFACLIGANTFGLTAPRADAIRMARSLYLYGIPQENITLFLNEKGTIKQINSYFKDLQSKISSDDVFFFYFAGHGSNKNRDSQLHLSQEVIQLKDLFKQITSLTASHAFMVIDACRMKINTIGNIKGISLLFATNNGSTFENSKNEMGEFTGLFLQCLANVNSESKHPFAELTTLLDKMCLEEKLPLPFHFQLGDQTRWFLPKKPVVRTQNQLIIRGDLLREIQLNLSKFNCPILWIWGNGGLGKSTLAKQVCNGDFSSVYTTIAKIRNPSEDVLNNLVLQIAPQLPTIYQKEAPKTAIAQEAIHELQRKEPALIWAIDHVERLNSNELETLISTLKTVDMTFLIISRFPPQEALLQKIKNRLILWQPKKFSIEETKQVLKLTTKNLYDAEALYLSTDGNPLKLKQVIANLDIASKNAKDSLKSLDKTLGALYTVGSYLDEELLAETFDITPASIEALQKMGLIGFVNEIFYPHDLLFEIVENEEIEFETEKAVDYWAKQVKKTPDNFHACRSLIFSLSHFESPAIPTDSTLIALRTLRGKENQQLLIDLAEKIQSNVEVAKALSHDLLDLGLFEIADNLIKLIKQKESFYGMLLEAERMWWTGNFQKALDNSLFVLQNTTDSKFIEYAHANIGLACFFLGEWSRSKEHLGSILNQTTFHNIQLKGWAESIMGTILAIRGENIDLGKKLLLQSINSFEECRNFNWIAVSWNNLGEIYWKIGQFHKSIDCLQKAYEIVRITKNEVLQIEVLRNQIQVYLRTEGPSSFKIHTLMNEIESIQSKSQESVEKMQYLNTFATIYAYKRDLFSLQHTLDELFELTKDNREYHIYTLANMSLLKGLQQELELSRQYATQAIELAKEGENELAIKQIHQDLKYCGLEFA